MHIKDNLINFLYDKDYFISIAKKLNNRNNFNITHSTLFYKFELFNSKL